MYQHLSVNATREKLEFKVTYVLETNNYAENLLELLKAKVLRKDMKVKKCDICRSSQIMIKGSSKDITVYDGQKEMDFKNIIVRDGEERLTYKPSNAPL
jgi:hypothetical protein